MQLNRLVLAAGLCIASVVSAGKLNGYNDRFVGHGPTMPPGPDEPLRAPHGPTMPPGPDEPIR